MCVLFRASFSRGLKKVRDADLRSRARTVIQTVADVGSLQEIEGVRKLRGSDRYFRIRLGDYRIGLSLDGDTVTFVRFLHRRDIYRYFP